MSTHFNIGDLVRVKALPGISVATLFDGQVGVIARLPIDNDISYEIYIDDRTLWLVSAELEPINSPG